MSRKGGGGRGGALLGYEALNLPKVYKYGSSSAPPLFVIWQVSTPRLLLRWVPKHANLFFVAQGPPSQPNRRRLEANRRQLQFQFHFSWGPGGPPNHAR